MCRLRTAFLSCAIFLFLTGRSISAFTVTDALGRTTEFKKAPDRIVIAGRGLLMIADALYLFPEASGRVVAIEKIAQGRGDFLDAIDPVFKHKTMLPVEVGAEQILSTLPDVVLLKSYMEPKLGKPLQTLGVEVVYIDLETPEQYERDIITLGKLLQNETRAQEIVVYYRSKKEWISRALADLPESDRPRVLLLYYTERDGKVTFNVPPRGWMQTTLVELAGGKPLWKSMRAAKGWIKVGFEQIAAWNPDYIFITAYFNDPEEVVQRLTTDPKWCSLNAVRGQSIYAFPGDYFSWDQPDPRWILGLLWLSTTLHPASFPLVDLIEETKNFYRVLYGLDKWTYERVIHPLLYGDIH